MRKFLFAIIVPALLLCFAAPASAQSIPQEISFQGKLSDSAGNPVTTSVDIRFRLYNAVTGGTHLWQEIHAGVTPDGNGLYHVMLGSVTAFSTIPLAFDETYWVEVEVSPASAGSYETLSPRYQLSTSPYAFRAGSLEGLDATVGEINQALQGIDAAVTATALSDLTNGATNGDSYHTHATAGDADTVDGLHAQAAASPNGGDLLALDGAGVFPVSAIPQGIGSTLDADLLDGADGTYYLDLVNATGVLAAANGGTGTDSSGVSGVAYVSSGTWSFDSPALEETRGGTGHGAYTAGDLLYATGPSTLSLLSVSGHGQGEVLQLDGTPLPVWTPANQLNLFGSSWTGSSTSEGLLVDNQGNPGHDGIRGETSDGTKAGLRGHNADTAQAPAIGVWGTTAHASGCGVRGSATGGDGVNGTATTGRGVYGDVNAAGGYGLYGLNSVSTGSAWGVYGEVRSPGGLAVEGMSTVDGTAAQFRNTDGGGTSSAYVLFVDSRNVGDAGLHVNGTTRLDGAVTIGTGAGHVPITVNGSAGATGDVLTIDMAGDPLWSASITGLDADTVDGFHAYGAASAQGGQLVALDANVKFPISLLYAGNLSGDIPISNGTMCSNLNADFLDDNEGTYYLSLANHTGTLAIANGGTGATTAGIALQNLGAAASGANSDITSLSGLTTPLSIGQGGTGLTGYATGDLLIGSTTNPLQVLGVPGSGNDFYLHVTPGSSPIWQPGSVPFGGNNPGDTLFWNGSRWAANANLHWDNTNGRLGVGTNSPLFLLDVNGRAQVQNTLFCNAPAGTAPLSVTSSTKVLNLNVDLLDSRDTGNQAGDIPISNGAMCATLNADMVDGQNASSFASSSHDHWGETWSYSIATDGLTLTQNSSSTSDDALVVSAQAANAVDASGYGWGVSGAAIRAYNSHTNAGNLKYGVYASITNTNTHASSAALYGLIQSPGRAVHGYATASTATGVYGQNSAGGYAGFFSQSGGSQSSPSVRINALSSTGDALYLFGRLNLNGMQVTSDANELNKLDGTSANVTPGNLNTLTGGVSADSLHTHSHSSITDIPGLNWVTNTASSVTISSVFSSMTGINQVSINAPAGGYVLVIGTGYASCTVPDTQSFYAFIGLGTSATSSTYSTRIYMHNQTGSSITYRIPFSISYVFSVSAGTNIFHLNGAKFALAGPNYDVWSRNLKAIYFPKIY